MSTPSNSLSEPFLAFDNREDKATGLSLSDLPSSSESSNIQRELIPSKNEILAEQLLDKLGLQREKLEEAGIDYPLLIKIIEPKLYNAFSRFLNYNDIQLKSFIFPFVGEESVADIKTPIKGVINKLLYYFNTRIWPRSQSLLYKSHSALRLINSIQVFLTMSGLVSEKAWTLLLLSLQINELIFYIKFYDNPRLRNYYKPFTFSGKIDNEKILSRSLSQLLVWVSIFAVPLSLGISMAGLTALTYEFDSRRYQEKLNVLTAYQAGWHPKYLFKGLEALNAANQALVWDGNLSNAQRKELFSHIVALAKQNNAGLLRFQAMGALAQNLSALHIKDVERLAWFGKWDDEEKEAFYKTLLSIKTSAYQALQEYIIQKPKFYPGDSFYKKLKVKAKHAIRAIYASWLLWSAGFPQSLQSNIAFWLLRGYVWYSKYTLLKAIVYGIQYEVDFYSNKKSCENDDNYWQFFDVPPKLGDPAGYYCSPCPAFPIQPKQKFESQECIWGLFNFTREYEELREYLDETHSKKAIKNWKGVADLSLSSQTIQGDYLSGILALLKARAKDLQVIKVEGNSEKPGSGIAFNQNAITTLAHWMNAGSLKSVVLRHAHLNNTLVATWATELSMVPSMEYLDLSSQKSGFSDAALLNSLLQRMPNLEVLNASSNGFNDVDIATWVNEATAQEKYDSLKIVDLSLQVNKSGVVSFQNATLLAPLLQQSPALELLDVEKNGFTDISMANLADNLVSSGMFHNLKSLNLKEQRRLSSSAIPVLPTFSNARVFTNLLNQLPNLMVLNIASNGLTDASIAGWTGDLNLNNTSLRLVSLDLSWQGGGDHVNGPPVGPRTFTNAEHLTDLIRHAQDLSLLNVGFNGFTDSSIASWASSMKANLVSSDLENLVLSGQIRNTFTDATVLSDLLPYIPRLKALDLSFNAFTNEGILGWLNAMSTSDPLRDLTFLDLTWQLNNAGVYTFSNASLLAGLLKKMPGLRTLNVGCNNFNDVEISSWVDRLLLEKVTYNLQSLSLGWQCFPHITSAYPRHQFTNATILSPLLQHFPKLQELDVSYSGFFDAGIAGLFKAMSKANYNSNLLYLDLSHQRIVSSPDNPSILDAGVLAGVFESFPQLRMLSLRANVFSNSGFSSLLASLSDKKIAQNLVTLDLCCQEGAVGSEFSEVSILAEFFKHFPNLVELEASNNALGDSGMRSFSRSLIQQPVSEPELWLLALSRKNQRARTVSENATSLRWLNLEYNQFGSSAAKELCSVIPFTDVNTLDGTLEHYSGYTFLDGNPIESQSLEVCAVTSGAGQLDLFNLFSATRSARESLSPQASFENVYQAPYKKLPYVMSNRHLSLPKCVGSYCDNFMKSFQSQPYELSVALYGAQATMFSTIMGLFGHVLQRTTMNNNQKMLTLSAVRFGINYLFGFKGYGIITREFFVHGLAHSLKSLGFDRITIARVASGTSLLMSLGLFILNARHSYVQFVLITVVSMLGSWLGHAIAEEATNYIKTILPEKIPSAARTGLYDPRFFDQNMLMASKLESGADAQRHEKISSIIVPSRI